MKRLDAMAATLGRIDTFMFEDKTGFKDQFLDLKKQISGNGDEGLSARVTANTLAIAALKREISNPRISIKTLFSIFGLIVGTAASLSYLLHFLHWPWP